MVRRDTARHRLIATDGTAASGFVPLVHQGMLASQPAMRQAWEAIATPAGAQLMATAQRQCSLLNDFKSKTFASSTYSSAGAGLWDVPAIASAYASIVMGTSQALTPTAPVFYVRACTACCADSPQQHCVADQIVPVATADKMVNAYCGFGVASLLVRTPSAAHP